MRSTGTIKFVNAANSFGFVQREMGEKDCFLLKSAIRHCHRAVLQAGDRVEFDVMTGAWGPYAVKVVTDEVKNKLEEIIQTGEGDPSKLGEVFAAEGSGTQEYADIRLRKGQFWLLIIPAGDQGLTGAMKLYEK